MSSPLIQFRRPADGNRRIKIDLRAVTAVEEDHDDVTIVVLANRSYRIGCKYEVFVSIWEPWAKPKEEDPLVRMSLFERVFGPRYWERRL